MSCVCSPVLWDRLFMGLLTFIKLCDRLSLGALLLATPQLVMGYLLGSVVRLQDVIHFPGKELQNVTGGQRRRTERRGLATALDRRIAFEAQPSQLDTSWSD